MLIKLIHFHFLIPLLKKYPIIPSVLSQIYLDFTTIHIYTDIPDNPSKYTMQTYIHPRTFYSNFLLKLIKNDMIRNILYVKLFSLKQNCGSFLLVVKFDYLIYYFPLYTLSVCVYCIRFSQSINVLRQVITTAGKLCNVYAKQILF